MEGGERGNDGEGRRKERERGQGEGGGGSLACDLRAQWRDFNNYGH